MKIVSFVAATSNSGKTAIIEKVVRILKERGLRVAVIKHAPKGFEVDRPGKDSWRFREAGADTVVLVGPDRLALMRTIDKAPSMKELEMLAGNADIMIREGFKEDALNKIEVFRSGISGQQPLCAADGSFLALVSDRSFDVAVPRFDWNDAEAVADFIATKL
jgi:molybdopterin-guanine dinucleotide biosynthesis adapter protein